MKSLVSMVRGILSQATAAAGHLMTAGITARPDETLDNIRMMQHYGLQSRPREGAEVVVLRQGNDITIVCSDDSTYRLSLADGDAILYSNTDNYIKMKGAGGIEIYASDNVVVNANNIKLGASVGLRKLIDERIVDFYNAHTHTAPGGTTGVPVIQLVTAVIATDTVEAI